MSTDTYLTIDGAELRAALVARLRGKFDEAGVTQCEAALSLAESVHEQEQRDERTPYIVHPLRVALRLLDFAPNSEPDDVCVALLHDSVESGGATLEEIERTCGEATARIVRRMTHDGLEPKSSYLTAFVSAPRRVQRIKLADRLDNVWSLTLNPNPEKRTRYLQETEDYVLSWGRMADRPLAKAIEEAMQAVFQAGKPTG